MPDVDQLLDAAICAVKATHDIRELGNLKITYLGKKGKLTNLMKQVSEFPVEQRPRVGQAVNQAKKSLEQAIAQRRETLEQAESNSLLEAEKIDVTMPGRTEKPGCLHPITRTLERIQALFWSLGFEIHQGPEIESDFYNFEALNIPHDHPARDMHDTFYFPDGRLLRTHMSPVQIHVMETQSPPISLIAPGRVYRKDSDLTHTPMFHQVEGLMVDKGIHFGHLKGILNQFLRNFFESEKLNTRFRPSFFPFTEPSAEVDISCFSCRGRGCRICSHSGWLEVLGCGMVHPNVFGKVGISTEIFTGFAFGMGVERLSMLRYGVDDLRLFFENDLRFLQQFS